MNIFDSHAHYDDESFDEDRQQILKELACSNVVGVLNCGSSLQGARDSVKLAEENEIFYAAVGIHPEYANEVDEKVIEELKKLSNMKRLEL